MISTIHCQMQMAVQSSEILLGYDTSSQTHTFHKPTFIKLQQIRMYTPKLQH